MHDLQLWKCKILFHNQLCCIMNDYCICHYLRYLHYLRFITTYKRKWSRSAMVLDKLEQLKLQGVITDAALLELPWHEQIVEIYRFLRYFASEENTIPLKSSSVFFDPTYSLYDFVCFISIFLVVLYLMILMFHQMRAICVNRKAPNRNEKRDDRTNGVWFVLWCFI